MSWYKKSGNEYTPDLKDILDQYEFELDDDFEEASDKSATISFPEDETIPKVSFSGYELEKFLSDVNISDEEFIRSYDEGYELSDTQRFTLNSDAVLDRLEKYLKSTNDSNGKYRSLYESLWQANVNPKVKNLHIEYRQEGLSGIG
jgi:hypothetical protein